MSNDSIINIWTVAIMRIDVCSINSKNIAIENGHISLFFMHNVFGLIEKVKINWALKSDIAASHFYDLQQPNGSIRVWGNVYKQKTFTTKRIECTKAGDATMHTVIALYYFITSFELGVLWDHRLIYIFFIKILRFFSLFGHVKPDSAA